MLVITRREGEEVVIGDPKNPIGVVRIASIRGDRVRIAFDFPREVQVHRREIADQIRDGVEQVQVAGEAAPVTAKAEVVVRQDVIGHIRPKAANG
jgi:carbon storage regulator CsrA